MKTVHQVSQLTGVSIRTLHHYDAIGLLKPSYVSPAGYRYYDEQALSRLQSILLFRELQFPLQEIKAMLDHPGFDAQKALKAQIQLLTLQKERLEGIIEAARKMQKEGMTLMDFSKLDKKPLEDYAREVKDRWGDTAAYREYRAKPQEEAQDSAQAMMELFTQFGAMKHLDPVQETVQSQVKALQDFITAHYYTCTKEILANLGAMYTADPRFKENIDAHGGEGTAAFVQKAIAHYCR